jgi:hypothetical protein
LFTGSDRKQRKSARTKIPHFAGLFVLAKGLRALRALLSGVLSDV